jgi:DNA-binding GntR family transcriptional regulator
MTSAFAPLNLSRAPLRDAIIGTLRGAMEAGELAPGAPLVERTLCEQLGVSRPSLREALRQLEAEGVVARRGVRGLAVAEATPSEARAAYSLRAAIQVLIVGQFIERATEAQRARLQAATEALLAAYRSGQLNAILGAKRAFFAALCAGADNPLAPGIIDRLCLRVAALRSRAVARSERNTLSIGEIERLVDAVLRGDRAEAEQAMLAHIESVRDWTLHGAAPAGRAA